MKTYKIAVLRGDGIGPEVVREGLKVLDVVSKREKFSLDLAEFDLGGERYLRTGEVLPDSVIDELRRFDAIYLGAIGHPDVRPGVLEKGILLRLRFDLDLYINLRPVKLYENVPCPIVGKGPKEIDYVVVRENSGDVYTGAGGISMKGTPHEVAIQEMVYSRHQVERCLRWAFAHTKARNKRNTLALCGKTNVLTYVFDLWERAFHEIGAKDFPGIAREYYHVDATCMHMINQPERFDVIVTGNMFGDIITDLGAVTQGGMGMAASGNINPEKTAPSMFEPVHGSAPDIAGKNLANPLAAILSAKMMLEFLGEEAAGATIERAVMKVVRSIHDVASGKMGKSTSTVGDEVADAAATL